MKKTILSLLTLIICFKVTAQISNTSISNNSLTISPNGIVDNRPQSLSATSKYIAIGDSAMFSNSSGGDGVIAIGSKAMAKSSGTGYSVAIGTMSMYNAQGGYSNVAVGGATLINNTGIGNTAIGNAAQNKNTTGIYNSALGSGSLGGNEIGNRNVAIGSSSLSKTNSDDNIGIGYFSLLNNSSGVKNLAIGNFSLSNNSKASNNIAIGYNSLKNFEHLNLNQPFETYNISIGNYAAENLQTSSNYTFKGQKNIAIGENSLKNSSFGAFNTSIGYDAMANSSGSDNNVAIGLNALIKNQDLPNASFGMNTSIGNYSLFSAINVERSVGVGMSSGNGYSYGSDNIFIGYHSGVTDPGISYYNSMAIGNDAVVNVSNKVVIGNSSVTQIGGYATWSNYSDKRLKENIIYSSDLGLDFIKQLKTVRYNYKEDKNKKIRDGLIAQDIQEILKKNGWKFSGLIEDNDTNHTLNLSYTEFVLPLINSVQELSRENDKLKKEIQSIQNDLKALTDLVKMKDGFTAKSE